MTTKQWIGGGNDQAGNAADWSPAAAPVFGDTLVISNGTINVQGKALAGDALHVHALTGGGTVAAPTINVSRHGTLNLVLDPPSESTSNATVNVVGSDRVNATLIGTPANAVQLTENIAANSVLTGFIQVNRGAVKVEGAGTFRAEGTSTFSNDTATISTAVTGHGIIDVDQGGLELSGPVAVGPQFQLRFAGMLTIDDLASFHATVSDTGTGFLNERVLLKGIEATSYSFGNGLLQLFDGDAVVGRLHLQAGAGSVYAVQGATGVTVLDTSASTPPAGALPNTPSLAMTLQDFGSKAPAYYPGKTPSGLGGASFADHTGGELHMFMHGG